jgi:phosphocarrier protein FPr/phosphocarrier protein
MIAQTCAGAAKHHRWVGVCGGAASDLLAVPILLGLGVTELSATAAVVPEVKALVRSLDLTACRALAAQVLDLTSPEAVREVAKTFLAGV